MPQHTPDPIELLAALADGHRLQIAGLLVGQALTEAEIGRALELRPKVVQRSLRQLQSAGLVRIEGAGGEARYVSELTVLRNVVAAARPRAQRGPSNLGDATAGEQAVLMTFFEGDRLVSLPVQPAKLMVVLAWLAGRFEPGRAYPEQGVNDVLLRHHDDYATMRRLLVDHGFMTRERGVYRRVERERRTS
jgi:DNA-binding transcriptional ArsR family regulator